MRSRLVAAIQQAESTVDRDELAYLALTSKVELPFRDKLAFALARLLHDSGGHVAREFRRCDLAWVVDGKPRLLVELKACYTFDLLFQPEVYRGKVATDLAKALLLGGPTAHRAAILLATHPQGSIPLPLLQVVKYARDINRYLARHQGTEDALANRAAEAGLAHLAPLGEVVPFDWQLGSYAGVPVRLLGWLVMSSCPDAS